MPFVIETKLENIERELKEIKKEFYSNSLKKRFFNSAGKWSKFDTEKLKKNIYGSRQMTTKEKVEF